MAETQRTLSELLTAIPTGTPGAVTAQDVRDAIYSLFKREAVTVTGVTTLDTDADIVYADATGGSFTINLPAVAAASGMKVTIKKITAANTVTIDADGSETIDGATTKALTTQWSVVTLQCDGSAWFIIGN